MKSSNSQQLGSLSIIHVSTWATDLVKTLMRIVHASCEPARVAICLVARLYGTARSSNNLLGLDPVKDLASRENLCKSRLIPQDLITST